MQNDQKGKVHRTAAATTTVQYVLTWTNLQSVGGVGLPATNLTPTATIRLRGYSDTAGTTPVSGADTGVIDACAGSNIADLGWTGTYNVNGFAYGVLSKAEAWFDQHYNVRRIEIDIVDSSNPTGYIDCARIVAGAFFEPVINAQYGAAFEPVDSTQSSRNDAGDLVSTAGVVYDEGTLELKHLEPDDRAAVYSIIKGAGTHRNIYLSLLPLADDERQTHDHIIFGKRRRRPMKFDFFDAWSTQVEIDGW